MMIIILFVSIGCSKPEKTFTITVVEPQLEYNVSDYEDYACKHYIINETNEAEINSNYPENATNNIKLCTLPIKSTEDNSISRLCLKDCNLINGSYQCIGQYEKCIN